MPGKRLDHSAIIYNDQMYIYGGVDSFIYDDTWAFDLSDRTSLRLENPADYETKNSYSVRIRTQDEKGGFYEKPFTILIHDVNEVPTGMSLSQSSFNENLEANSIVATLSTTDPDVGNTYIYTFVEGIGDFDNSYFSISGADLKINVSPNYEEKSFYIIRLNVNDGVHDFENVFRIDVTDINEGSPTDIYINDNSNSVVYIIDDELQVGDIIGELDTIDQDLWDNHTYSLSGSDASSFSIDGTSLKVGDNYDSTKSRFYITITSQDSGGFEFSKNFEFISTTLSTSYKSKDLIVFKNPKEDFLYLEGEFKINALYKIYKITGVKVKQGSLNPNGIISLQTLANGVYLLKIENQAALRFVK